MDTKALFGKVKERLGSLSTSVKRLIAVAVAAVVLVSVVLAVVLNNQPYETLFADLTAAEATEIMGKLDDLGVGYRYDNAGTISVPSAQEPLVKAQLVSEGYPKSGLTYSVFSSNIGMTTTDFERQSYLLFDLQDRIAATIRHFDGVSDAIVTIATGEEQRYVLQTSASEASASVVVMMANGGSPGMDVVDGIVRLVMNSVPGGISEDNITVLDGAGRALNGTTASGATYGMSALKLSLEKEINATIQDELLYMLSPIFGEGKVRVSVNSTVDVDTRIREMIEYLPTDEENNRGIINSESHYADVTRAADEEGGVPGTTTNAEVPVYGGYAVEGDELYFQTQDDIDYVVSQIKEQVQSEAGTITDIMVSVAFDGNAPTDNRQQEIRTLIARVAGIENDEMNTKIAMYFDNFAVPDVVEVEVGEVAGFLQSYLLYILILVGVILLVALILVFVLRGRRKKKQAEAREEIEEALGEAGYPAPPDNYIMDIKLPDIRKTKEQELKNQIADFADQNPEISAQLIKTWLKGVDAQ